MGVYVLLEDSFLEMKELFYFKLDSMIGLCPARDVLVVWNDFNAGSDKTRFENET